jgi:hypothetical protein
MDEKRRKNYKLGIDKVPNPPVPNRAHTEMKLETEKNPISTKPKM